MSTKSANHKLGQPGGVALCDKDEQVVGFRGALFGYFLGMQKVTKTKQPFVTRLRRDKLVTLFLHHLRIIHKEMRNGFDALHEVENTIVLIRTVNVVGV